MIGFSHPHVPTEVNLLDRTHIVRFPIYEAIDRNTGQIYTFAALAIRPKTKEIDPLLLSDPVDLPGMYDNYPTCMLKDVQDVHHAWAAFYREPVTEAARFLGFSSVRFTRTMLSEIGYDVS